MGIWTPDILLPSDFSRQQRRRKRREWYGRRESMLLMGCGGGGVSGPVELVLSAEKDTGTLSAAPTFNSNTALYVSGSSVAGTYSGPSHSFLHFDLSAFASITAANLELTAQSSGGSGPLYVDRLTQTAWVENQATWNVYSTGNNWAAPGGDANTDLRATGTLSVGDADITALAQWALANAAGQLHIMLSSDTGLADAVYKHRLHATEADRPKLTVTGLLA